MDKKKIISYIQKHHMIQPGDFVIAAVSGGADSVALLLILRELSKEMSFSLCAVHVEHGIRGEESLKDMRFTEKLCERLEVPLRIFRVDAPSFAKENGLGLEEAARKLRYERLEAAARELQQEMADAAAQALQQPVSDTAAGKLWKELPEAVAACPQKSSMKTGTVKIALAHHMQDQAETVLFRLVRGSGLNGLAGMQPVRQGMISETQGTCGDDISETQDAHQNGVSERRDMHQNGISERQDTHQNGVSERQDTHQNGASGRQGVHQDDASETQVAHQAGLNCTYIRPLLATSRSEIEEYLAECGQAYCVDSTNLDESYARNRIRSRVMPELTGVNAQAAAHIAQTAEQAAEISDYIAGEAARKFERIATVENGKYEAEMISPTTQGIGNPSCSGKCPVKISIEIPKLLCLHTALQKEILRQALIRIADHEKDLAAGHIAQLMEIAERTSGKEISLPYDVVAAREFDRLILRKRMPVTQSPMDFIEISAVQLEEIKKTGKALRVALSASEEMVFRICGVQNWEGDILPGANETSSQNASECVAEVSSQKTFESANELCRSKIFDYEKLKDGFAIRHRQPGDYFRMKDGHRKKLKQYLIEEKIPASERPKLWLLAHGSQILWLPGGREDPALRPCGSTEFVISVEYRVV